MKSTVKERSNTQICLSFGRDEVELLDLLDEGRKQEHISSSTWFKNQIREKYGKQSHPYLSAVY